MTGIITVPLHIGDFLSGTLHMDTLEKGAYVMLMLAHYQAGHSGMPNDDVKLSRIAGVSMSVWKRIKPLLMEKFEVSGEFLVSEKCQKVLSGVEEKSSAQRAKALKRHNRGHATAKPQQCQPKPKPNISSSKEDNIRPTDVSESVWGDYLKTRKAKKAGPPTETAINGIRREAEGVGWTLEQALRKCVERSWVGFEARWVTEEKNGKTANRHNAMLEGFGSAIARDA